MWLLRMSLLLYVISTQVSCRCSCLDRIILLINDDDYRLVSSPDYPRYYCPSLSCSWRIMGPYNESNIYFYSENLDLRDQVDFLEFYDGLFLMPDEDAHPSYRCTGRGECKYNTETNLLTIKFVSDIGSSENFGFQGTVSTYNRQLRHLTSSVGRFCIPIAVIFIVLIAFITSVAFCRKRSQEVRQKETEELLDGHLDA